MDSSKILISKRSTFNAGKAHNIALYPVERWEYDLGNFFWSANTVEQSISCFDIYNIGIIFEERAIAFMNRPMLPDTFYTFSFETSNSTGGYLELTFDELGVVYSAYGNTVHSIDLISYSGYGVDQITIVNMDGWSGDVKNFSFKQNTALSPVSKGYYQYEPYGYLDVYDDIAIPITFQTQDIENLSTRNSSFSKTITLPATQNNKKILGHLDNMNTDYSVFNPNEKVVATVLRNEIPVFEGYLQLLSINEVNQNNDTAREFEVRIFDDKQNVFKEFGKRSLQELDYGDFDHTLRLSAITDNWASGSTWTKGYHYPLYYSQSGKYELKHVYPAFFVRSLIDRMFENIGYTYEIESRIEPDINRLIIPYTGEKPRKPIEQIEDSKTIATNSATTSYNSIGSVDYNNTGVVLKELEISNEIQDGQNGYEPSTALFTAPLTGEFRVEFSASASMVVTEDSIATLGDIIGQNNSYVTISIVKNGLQRESSLAWYFPVSSPAGSYNKDLKVSAIINMVQGDTLDFKVEVSNKNKYLHLDTGIPGNGYVDVNTTVDDVHLDISQLGGDLVEGDLVRLNNYLPDMTQAELLKNLIKMYNLQLDYSNSSNNIKLITRDSFYSGSTILDWEDLVDNDSEVQTLPLNEVQSKRLNFTYKESDDVWNDNYTKSTGSIYGEYIYDFENDFYDEDEKIELSFIPTPFVKNRVGLDNLYVPAISCIEPKSSPRILYINEPLSTQDSITFLTANGNGSTGFTETVVPASKYYPCLHIGNEVINNNANLNFGEVDSSLLYENFDMSDATLFNRYYSRTINQIASGKMKIAYFRLSPKEINEIKDNLNARIWCFNEYWTINKVVDYDASRDGLTKVELILYEDKEWQTNFKRFQTVPTTQQAQIEKELGLEGYNSTTFLTMVNGFFNEVNNWTNIVNGNSNTVNSTGNTIFGNNNYVTNNVNNTYIYGDNITANTPNTVYFFSTGTTIGPSGATYYNFIDMSSTALTINNVVNMTTGGTTFYDGSVNITTSGITIGDNIFFGTGGTVSLGTGLDFCLSGEPQPYQMLQYSEGGCWDVVDLYLRSFSGGNTVIDFNGSDNDINPSTDAQNSGFIGGLGNYLGGNNAYSFWFIATSYCSGDTASQYPVFVSMLSSNYCLAQDTFSSSIIASKYSNLLDRTSNSIIGASNLMDIGDALHATAMAANDGEITNSIMSTIVGSDTSSIIGSRDSNIIGGELNIISGQTNGDVFDQNYSLTSSTRNSQMIGGDQNSIYNADSSIVIGGFQSTSQKDKTTLINTSGLTVDSSSDEPDYTTYVDHFKVRGANYEEATFTNDTAYTASTYDSIIILTQSGALYDVYLPPASENAGRKITWMLNYNLATPPVCTINTQGSDLINGDSTNATTYGLNSGESVTMISNGSNRWFIIG